MQPLRQFTEQEQQLINELYNTLVPVTQICKQLKVGEAPIKRYLREQGLPLRRKYPPRTLPDQSLVGQQFNSITVEAFIYNDKYHEWNIIGRCECGNPVQDVTRKIINGGRKTCGVPGCAAFHQVRQNNGRQASFTGYEEIYGSRWGGWKCGAAKRNIPFELTPQEGWDIFVAQQKRCALSGVDIEFGTAWNKKCTASLDRIDSTKRYTVDNVQWVHKMINVMKRDMTDEQFISWCKLVLHHQSTTDT
jgi:hypothetical protein